MIKRSEVIPEVVEDDCELEAKKVVIYTRVDNTMSFHPKIDPPSGEQVVPQRHTSGAGRTSLNLNLNLNGYNAIFNTMVVNL